MTDVLRDIIRRNRVGEQVAIVSVCSSHPDVLRASLAMAERLDRFIVIEATSNQVNQDGGYTGMVPADYIASINTIAHEAGVCRERIVLGGDHLGPQVWRELDGASAMAKAEVMMRAYVKAGFSKIHIDCSEGCAGEPLQLSDELTAERSARLARMCCEISDDLLFVVGTEVPPPGGVRAYEDGVISPTSPDAALKTLEAHDTTFGDMSDLIGGLVVQPGVEFGATTVHALPLERDPQLRKALVNHPHVCLEAHSTDYQAPGVYPRLADLGFAFQKVGPALTYAYRQALYALDQLRSSKGALERAMEAVMLARPSMWQGHYAGDQEELAAQRHVGLSDRIRYYWPTSEAQMAVQDLFFELESSIPDAVLLTVFDQKILDRAEGLQGSQAQRLIYAQIEFALAPYFF